MDDVFDPALKGNIANLMAELPIPVRDFFASGQVRPIAQNLTQKYRLHMDQGTVLQREILMLLLGIQDQQGFQRTLIEDGHIDSASVSGITADVNQLIFIPLNERLRRGGDMATVRVQAPRPTAPIPPPPPRYGPVPQAQTPLQPKPAPQPFVPNISVPSSVNQINRIPVPPPMPTPQAPTATPVTSAPLPPKAVMPSAPPLLNPLPPPVMNRPAPPPPNLPGAMPATFPPQAPRTPPVQAPAPKPFTLVPQAPPPPAPPAPPEPPKKPAPPARPTGGVDPYREAVE